MVTLKIGSFTVGGSSPCFTIAEAGVNHNGRLDLAKNLVDAAVAAQVDAVKFQTFRTDDLILEDIEKASYQKKTTQASESQTSMLRKLEIDKAFHQELIAYCRQKNIMFCSTCYEPKSLRLLVELDVPFIKIASTDTTNLLFLEEVAKTGKPVILSTGMCSRSEIELAYQTLKDNGCSELGLLKCTSNYPTALNEVNLRAMTALNDFDAVIGFSDHTPGVGASPYAVALGAKIVEKHFTLDKNMEGPDHKASLSPDELKQWVKEIRAVEEMLGSKELKPTASEQETKKMLQKCLVTAADIKKGTTLTRAHVFAKRTGGRGIGACESYQVLGKTVTRDMKTNEPLEWAYLG